MNLDKSLITNCIALTLTVAGLLLPPPLSSWVLSVGMFALSGAVTNWLAIYMLFERVPGFYGSGVVPLHFEEFKRGIRKLIMQQFFTAENIEKFLQQSSTLSESVDAELARQVDRLDLGKAYESLLDVIMASSFGSMLGMFGGRDALKPLREPFILKMQEYLHSTLASESFRNSVAEGIANALPGGDALHARIEHIVDRRLDELTPQLVKEIVQAMIRKHLGWLVVWGGVLGGLIGLLARLAGLE